VRTVVETPGYLRAAKDAGMTEAEMKAAVDQVASNPRLGDLIPGAGGCRKVQLAGRGKGKSGGYRVITFFAEGDAPVFLLTVFSKGERANLSAAEKVQLGQAAKTLAQALRGKRNG